MAIDVFRDPLYIKWYTDSQGNKISVQRLNEQYQIVKNKIILAEIPDEFYKVQISGFNEVKIGKTLDTEEFSVNYTLGEITFHSSHEAKTIIINQYYSRGILYYPASRIFTDFDPKANLVTETLKNVVDNLNHKGEYNPLTTYYPRNIAYYAGGSYMCIQKCMNIPPSNTSYWQQLTSPGLDLVFRGEYDNGLLYDAKDAVSYGGSIYYCLISSTGHLPTDTNYWSVFMPKSIAGILKNTVTLSSAVSNVNVGISGYNYQNDELMVFINSTYIEKDEDYTININGLSIDKINGTWETGTVINFLVIKNVLTNINFNDGSILQDASVAKTKLTLDVQNKLDQIGNLSNLATTEKTNLVGAISEVKNEVTTHEAENVQSPRTFGAHSITETGYESFDSTQAFINMFSAFPDGIKIEAKPDDVFIVNNVTISTSNIDIDFKGATIKKISGAGYSLLFSGSLTQKNIKIKNMALEGDNTVIANGGLAFATDPFTSAIDGLILENITCKNFAQYGINIGAVSNFSYKNIKVLNHGSIAVGATIGIGFVIFPKNAQANGFIDGIYSEINLAATITSAAIKLQCVSNLQASKIHGVNGTEECISISAINNGEVSDIIIESTGDTGYSGLAISSNDVSVTPIISNASFTLKNIRAKGKFSNEIILSNSNSKGITLDGVDISTLTTSGSRIVIAQNGVVENCKFKNIKGAIRFDAFTGGLATGCEFDDVTINNGLAFTVVGNDNIINNVKTIASGTIKATGNDNVLNNCTSIDSTTNAFQLAGDGNILENSRAINPTGRNLYVSSGAGNRYKNFTYIGGTGILNSGTGTIGLLKGTTALRPVLAASDVGYKYQDTTLNANGKPIEWNGTAWIDATGATV